MVLVSEHPFGQRRAAGAAPIPTARLYRLKNGLKVILLADASAPVLAYQTWFAVGSRHEREGTTGIAHLFEHLMFNQTESHPPGEFDRLLERVGGETNAATWVDWTHYRNNMPRKELELVIDLESDRMAHLVLGDKQVESEREVVANERRFSVEDSVDGFLSEELYKLAFVHHPYHWPTIGWMKDIHAITIDDCRAFYRTYYAPNNATLVLVGDFDERAALAMIEKRYGAISPQPIPPDAIAPEPPQTAERRASFEKPVAADKLQIGYRSPPMGHRDYPVLEVLSEALFGGSSSRLFRQLVVEEEIASSLHATPAPFRDPGLYEIAVALKRGHVAAEAEAKIYAGLAHAAAEPLTEAELETAKTRLLTRFWRELRPQAGKAEALGHYQTTVGDYRRLFDVERDYRAVTAADVRRVAGAYLLPSARTVVVATPHKTSGAAKRAER
jgi:zinc protease